MTDPWVPDVERHAGKNAETEDQLIERLLGDRIERDHVIVDVEYPAQSRRDQREFGS
jgi:hypothetical protein